MAKKIIILDRTDIPSDLNYNFAFWADVPAARQAFYANASATSQYKQASAGELSAIQGGAVVERVQKITYPAGTALSTIQADLIAKHTAFQAEITGYNAWNRYGTNWDGTTWTVAGGVVNGCN